MKIAQHLSPSKVPTVSIGMPTYNAEAWVAEAVEALLCQTFTDFELIICDNASTDRTYAICEELARRDSRIRLERHPRNLGANRNYLAVLKRARGEFFKWASSNDFCAPTFIARCVEVLRKQPDVVLACPRSAIFQNRVDTAVPYDRDFALLEESPASRFQALTHRMTLNNAMNGVIRRDALMRVSEIGSYMGADIILMGELALLGKFQLIDEVLFFRRMSPESATKLRSAREAELHIVPTATRPLKWQTWRYHWAVLNATRLVPFASNDWLRMVTFALRGFLWSRHKLMGEVVRGLAR